MNRYEWSASIKFTGMCFAVFLWLISTSCVKRNSSNQEEIYSGPFILNTFQMEEGYRLISDHVFTSEMNTFAGRNNPGGKQTSRCSKFHMAEGTLSPIMNVPDKLDGQKHVAMFFADNRVLSTTASTQENPAVIEIIDTETGMTLDMTPEGLTQVWNEDESLPLVAWSPKHGLCLYTWDSDSHDLTLWSGHNSLQDRQTVIDVIAIGHRMDNDGRHTMLVTLNLELLEFDEPSGTFIQAEVNSGLGASIANAAVEVTTHPIQFAACQNLAVLMTSDNTHYAIVSPGDVEDYIPINVMEKEKPDWLELAQSEPAYVINAGFVIPLNNEEVGIFDQSFQRLVVIENPGA